MKQLKDKRDKLTFAFGGRRSAVGGLMLTPREARPELFGACQVRRRPHDRVG